MERKQIFIITLIIYCTLFSCFPSSDEHRRDGELFHASIPYSGSVGGLYFGLYKDQQYQICSTGGIGQDCYTGKYLLNNDTLTLLDLNKQVHLNSNKWLIIRYTQPKNSELGEVVPLNNQNGQDRNQTYFVIRMDSLQLKY